MSVAGSGAAASGGSPLPPPVLVAETGDVRQFARLLRGIGLKHNAVMSISEAGFAVTVEEVKTLCAIAWIPTNLFSEFTFNEPTDTPACFELSLDGLLQCLNIFGNASTGAASGPVIRNRPRWAGDGNEDDAQSGQGGNKRGAGRTNMRMIWQGTGWPLSILLKDDNRGPVTNCELKVLEPEELMNQEFNRDECVLYLIMKSEWFRDALADLPPSSSKITLAATPRNQPLPEDQPAATASSNARRDHRAEVGNFSIKAEGDFGTTELDYPNDKEVMDRFDCDSEVSYSYHSSHFALLSRALNQSIKICLMIETDGFLCIQIMMPVQEGIPMGSHSGILEFKMHALEDDL